MICRSELTRDRSPTSAATTCRSRSASRPAAGWTTPITPSLDGRIRPGRSRPRAATRCCCTSPPAPPRSPSWWSTPTLSYPVGHLSTMYWIGLQPGDVHLNVSSPGWAKHAWSCFFAPWIAGATVLLYNYARFDAARLLDVLRDAGVTTFCAPPTVWRMLVQQDLAGLAAAPARAGRRRRAAQPRGDRAGAAGLGDDHPGRLRPDRDHRAGRQPARCSWSSPARWAGRCPATGWCWSTRSTGEACARAHEREGEICRRPATDAAGRADGRLPATTPSATTPRWRDGLYHTGDVASRGRRRLPHLRRADRRRVQVQRLPDQPVRAGERADRAPGGGRGRRRARAGPAAAVGAQGLRGAGRRLPARRRTRRRRSWRTAASTWRRTSGSAGWSSPSCPRRSAARSAGWSCAAPSSERAGQRAGGEFREEDFNAVAIPASARLASAIRSAGRQFAAAGRAGRPRRRWSGMARADRVDHHRHRRRWPSGLIPPST